MRDIRKNIPMSRHNFKTKGDLTMKNIGFFGYGQMGGAIGKGLCRFNDRIINGEYKLFAYTPFPDELKRQTEGTPVTPCFEAEELLEMCDTVFIAVKPYQAKEALTPLKDKLAGKVIISMVNAWTLAMYREILGDDIKVQVIMPNTPILVGKGTLILAKESGLTPSERADVKELLESVAVVVELPEAMIPAAAGISGCGPAFMYLVIEALGDAGVKNGLPRKLAYELAAGTMAGAGAMVLATGDHPGARKDAVCSPGGTTIRGIAALEDAGARAAFMHAVDATLGK